MSPDVFQKNTHKILEQRNMAFLVVVVAMIANIVLVLKMYGHHERIILIPQNDLSKQIVFDGKNVSKDYLVDWSSSILSDLLTVNRYTVEAKTQSFLKLSVSSEALQELMRKNIRRIKADSMSTVFYPKDFHINQDQNFVQVSGTFLAYLGKDREPVVQDKTFQLSWRLAPNGCVLVQDLKEINNEDY